MCPTSVVPLLVILRRSSPPYPPSFFSWLSSVIPLLLILRHSSTAYPTSFLSCSLSSAIPLLLILRHLYYPPSFSPAHPPSLLSSSLSSVIPLLLILLTLRNSSPPYPPSFLSPPYPPSLLSCSSSVIPLLFLIFRHPSPAYPTSPLSSLSPAIPLLLLILRHPSPVPYPPSFRRDGGLHRRRARAGFRLRQRHRRGHDEPLPRSARQRGARYVRTCVCVCVGGFFGPIYSGVCPQSTRFGVVYYTFRCVFSVTTRLIGRDRTGGGKRWDFLFVCM